MKECLNCGKPVGNRNGTYCSRACRNKHLTRKDMVEEPKYPRTCQYCGEEFLARRPNAKYCSTRCNHAQQHVVRRERQGARPKPQGKLWELKRQEAFDNQGGCCWLCGDVLGNRWQLHHMVHNDHAKDSEHLVGLCKTCHNAVHGVTVCWVNGKLEFHGKAVDLLKEKGYGRNEF